MYDLKIIQPESDLFRGFLEYLMYLDKSLATLILGQERTSIAPSGVSIGGQNAGEKTRNDLLKHDAEVMSEHLRKSILIPYVRFNYGEEAVELTPYICFDVEPEEDLAEKATALNTLSQALNTFAGLGLDKNIDIRAILEEFNIPMFDTNGPIEFEDGNEDRDKENIDDMDKN